MTDLLTKQIIFTKYLSHLLSQFYETTITFGEAWRSDETCKLYAKEGKGIPFSCHEMRLAVDLYILREGLLSTDKSDYAPLGDYWKELPKKLPASIPIFTCWGGDFTHLNDPFHFSIAHNGIR